MKNKVLWRRICPVLLIMFFILSIVLLPTNKTDAAASKKVTIRFATNWAGNDAKAKYFIPMVEKFGQKNSNKFKLVIETAAGDDLRAKIRVEVAAGNPPDIWTYWGGGSILKPLVVGNIVLDISKYLNLSKVLKKEQISEVAWDFYTINGKIYGVPLEGYQSAFMVNKELFKKYNLNYPKTYDDLIKVAKVFNQHGIVPLALGSKGGNPSHFWFSELYCQYSNGVKEIKDLPKTWKFNTTNALQVAKLIADMKKNGVFPKDTLANGDWGPSFALYNNGKAAMVYTYPWMFGQIKPEILKVTEIINVPKMPGAVKDPSTFVSSSAVYGFVINRKSFEDPQKRSLLVEFADYLVSDEMIGELMKAGMVPVKKIKIDYNSIHPLLAKVLKFNEKKEAVPSHFNTFPDDNAFTLFQTSLDELFAGVITPEKFVQKVQTALDRAKK